MLETYIRKKISFFILLTQWKKKKFFLFFFFSIFGIEISRVYVYTFFSILNMKLLFFLLLSLIAIFLIHWYGKKMKSIMLTICFKALKLTLITVKNFITFFIFIYLFFVIFSDFLKKNQFNLNFIITTNIFYFKLFSLCWN